jgi:hypothetical protein
MKFLTLAVCVPVTGVRPVWMSMDKGAVFVRVIMVHTGWHLWVEVIVMSIVVSMPVHVYGSFMAMSM